jgi:DUF4097 and DUF4098 domain-containing protein YvlB
VKRAFVSFGILLAAGLLAAPAAAQQRTDTTFAVDRTGTLRLDNYDGRVLVRGWNEARLRVRAVHPARVEIDVRRSASAVHVEAESDRGPARGVEYEIDVPRGWNVHIDGHSVSVVVQEIGGNLVASTVNGDIIARGVAEAHLDNVNGEIMLRNARGSVHVETVNKSINIDDIVGDVNAESVNGAVLMAGIDAAIVTATSVSGRIQFAGRVRAGGTYSFDTHNGDVTVTLPAGTGADVHVATHSGSIEADFPVQLRTDAGRSGELGFTIGRGGAQLNIESFNGAIRILSAQRRRP